MVSFLGLAGKPEAFALFGLGEARPLPYTRVMFFSWVLWPFGIFFLASAGTWAAGDQQEASAWAFQAVFGVRSQSSYRGALTWPAASALVGASVSYKDLFVIKGPSLTYQALAPRSRWQLALKSRWVDDNSPLIKLEEHHEDYRNQRAGAWELGAQLRYRWGPRQGNFVGLQVIHELLRYQRPWVAFSAQQGLAPYTSLQITTSLGEKGANQYAYGAEATSGFGHQEAKIQFSWPHLPFPGILTGSVGRHWVLQNKNRRADFIRGDDRHWAATLLLIAFL